MYLMTFQQFGGIVLLTGFLGFLAYQLVDNLVGLRDGPILIALFAVIALILFMLVRKIALEDR